SLALAIYSASSIYLLRYFTNDSMVGTYATATRLVGISSYIPTAIYMAMLPSAVRLASAGEEGRGDKEEARSKKEESEGRKYKGTGKREENVTLSPSHPLTPSPPHPLNPQLDDLQSRTFKYILIAGFWCTAIVYIL